MSLSLQLQHKAERVARDNSQEQIIDNTKTLLLGKQNILQGRTEALEAERVRLASRGETEGQLELLLGMDSNLLRLNSVMSKALSGDIALGFRGGPTVASENIAASDFNAAAAGKLSKDLYVVLETAEGEVHEWAGYEPDAATSGVTATDVDIAAPTVVWGIAPTLNAEFLKGVIKLSVTFDTDAGATKTYQAGDTLTVTVKATGVPFTAGVVDLVKTYNVV
jgi:hypothetical protein